MFFGPFPSKPPPRLEAIPPSFWPQCRSCIATYLTLCPIVVALYKAHFFSAVGRMPRTKGINVISKILPNGEYGWQGKLSLLPIKSSQRRNSHVTPTTWRGIGSKPFAMGWRSRWVSQGCPTIASIGALQLRKEFWIKPILGPNVVVLSQWANASCNKEMYLEVHAYPTHSPAKAMCEHCFS